MKDREASEYWDPVDPRRKKGIKDTGGVGSLELLGSSGADVKSFTWVNLGNERKRRTSNWEPERSKGLA